MLVLTRKGGEGFLIGDDIEISIVEIQGDKVKIGINAPRNISILREELLAEARGANEEAASATVSLKKLCDILGK